MNVTGHFQYVSWVAGNSTTITPFEESSPASVGPTIAEVKYEVSRVGRAVGIAIIFPGILTNVLTIRAFYKMGLADSATIVFFNLAIADLFVLFFSSISFCLYYLIVPPVYSYYMIVKTISESALAFKHGSYDATTYLTTFLAVQRCLCVALPLRFKYMFTRRRNFIITCMLWGVCLMQVVLRNYVYWPSYTVFRLPNSTTINKIRLYRKLERIAVNIRTTSSVILRPICCIVVLFCVFIMAYALKKSIQFRQQMASSSQTSKGAALQSTKADEAKVKDTSRPSSKESQVIVQVTLVLLIFLVATIPGGLLALNQEFDHRIIGIDTRANFIFFRTTQNLLLLNSAVNFFVYYVFNKKFKQLCFKGN